MKTTIKIDTIAKLIGTLDNDGLNEIVAVVKNHRKKLAHATKMNLSVGMKVHWGAMGHGVVDKINRTRCVCTKDDGTRWTIPITMMRAA
jgi:hypothetical protein